MPARPRGGRGRAGVSGGACRVRGGRDQERDREGRGEEGGEVYYLRLGPRPEHRTHATRQHALGKILLYYDPRTFLARATRKLGWSVKPRSPRCSVTPGGSCFSRCSQRNCRHIPPLPLGQTHRHAHEQAAHTTQRAHWHLVSSVPGRRGAGHRYTDTHAYYTHLQIELSFMPAAMVGWLPAGLHLTGVWLVARLLYQEHSTRSFEA